MRLLTFAPLLGLCACQPPAYVNVTPGVAHEDVVYAFEVESRKNESDRVRVIVCHRFGNPPCVTMPADDLTGEDAYARWRSDAATRNRRAQTRAEQSPPSAPGTTAPPDIVQP